VVVRVPKKVFYFSVVVFRRIRNKYESEIKELEKSESNMQQKHNTMKVS
jgi:hypothetical protein